MPHRFAFLVSIVVSSADVLFAQTPGPAAKPALPTVLLLGDSVRLGYAPLVTKRLARVATVVSPVSDDLDSAGMIEHLDDWLQGGKPLVVHFSCGLHDSSLAADGAKHRIDVDFYSRNLARIVKRLREVTPTVVFANITPVNDAKMPREGAWTYRDTEVDKYNAAALAVMRDADVPIHDLHGIIDSEGRERLQEADGLHFTESGNERIAEAVADCIARHVSVATWSNPAPVVPAVDAAQKYYQDQADRDAAVPDIYKHLPYGKFEAPASSADWQARRPQVLKVVVDSLGDLPPRPSPQKVRIITRELYRDFTVERITIDNDAFSPVTALVLTPAEKATGLRPAVLWLHSSTPDKNGVLTPNSNGGAEPLGVTLVKAGYVVMAPDACWYGDRAELTPAGVPEAYVRGKGDTLRKSQESLLKLNLWFGRTLWGMFVRDDQIALDYLCSRPEVDAKRIGATGISMGSTRSWWLAAVDDRIASAVCVACFTRYQNLIEHGELRAHGVYYFTNGILKHFDSEGVLSLVAPRPLLALTGDLDKGSPADGIRVLEDQLKKVYAANGAADRFRNVIYPNTGHVYTPEMRSEMLAWFDKWLKNNK
jgi:lysophospholipase L1-like esterase/dienelactone hydrolase